MHRGHFIRPVMSCRASACISWPGLLEYHGIDDWYLSLLIDTYEWTSKMPFSPVEFRPSPRFFKAFARLELLEYVDSSLQRYCSESLLPVLLEAYSWFLFPGTLQQIPVLQGISQCLNETWILATLAAWYTANCRPRP